MYCAIGGIHTHESGVMNRKALVAVELLGLHGLLTAPFHIPNVRGYRPIEQGQRGDFTEGSPIGNLQHGHRSVKGVPWSF